jgi:4-hydroxyproline epimerase
MSGAQHPIRVIDSHTEGEPTRVVIDGGPDLGTGPLADRVRRFREAHGDFRRAVILEPRGSDALVGALILAPDDRAAAAGVIFFNNTGLLGMCGHGAIGVAVTLAHLGRIGVGRHRLETPVGTVEIDLLDAHRVAIDNVPSYRHLSGVRLAVEGIGEVVGDVAWGGNWFFLASPAPCALVPGNIGRLTAAAESVRRELVRHGITGADGAEIDHVEFFSPPLGAGADSRNKIAPTALLRFEEGHDGLDAPAIRALLSPDREAPRERLVAAGDGDMPHEQRRLLVDRAGRGAEHPRLFECEHR